jgi:branched-chain amino acid transport system substrate-binding protein
MNWRRGTLGLLIVGLVTSGARAADPLEINVLLPLSGQGTFIGTEQLKAVNAIEALVNKQGGINGRPIKFVVGDEQSNPQVALQLVQGLIAKHVSLILGPTISASCGAVAPLAEKEGPVDYCLSNSIRPTPGSYVFSSLFQTRDMLAVSLRYFRQRGFTRIAAITSTDASGQDAERALLDGLARPENKGLDLVAREHFALADISVAAQMTRIKAADPQAIVAWAAGTPAGTLFHGILDAGITLPVLTSPGNLNLPQMKQYASFLPKELLFPGAAFFAPDSVDRPTRAAIAQFTSALATVGGKPDMIFASTWDPVMLTIDALRKLGPDATAGQLHDYLEKQKGWVGINGRYDFVAIPQRGIDDSAALVVRWDPDKTTWIPVSRLGGKPL